MISSLIASLIASQLIRTNLLVNAKLRQSATTSDTTPGFVLANFTLFSRELVKSLEVSASIYNLFYTHHSDPVSVDFTQQFIEQDGRNFRVKLPYKF